MASIVLPILLLLASSFSCIQADLPSFICSSAVNPSLCSRILKDPRARGADFKGLGLIVTEKAEAATRDVIMVVKAISHEETKKIVKECVKTCNDAIHDLKRISKLLKNYKKGSKEVIRTVGWEAITNAETCSVEFGESEPPVVKDVIQRVKDIIDILLVIATSLDS